MKWRPPLPWPLILGVTFVQSTCIEAAATAQSTIQPTSHRYANHVAQAARQFAIPERWIWAVMAQESGGNSGAVSRAGAMGLMQIMPATWTDLRARHGLGRDPYEPRDNILAGAAYLRAMYERYGLSGMLAAYNAGPGRYEAYLRGRPLPDETRAYLARLLPIISVSHPQAEGDFQRPQATPWTEAALFPGRAAAPTMAPTPGLSGMEGATTDAPHRGAADPVHSLFIARTGGKP